MNRQEMDIFNRSGLFKENIPNFVSACVTGNIMKLFFF
jgi:hypothetical protein